VSNLKLFCAIVKAYGSYDNGDIDSVNTSNGNLVIFFPLDSYGQRGDLAYKRYITYNNKWWIVVQSGTGTQQFLQWQWNVGQKGEAPGTGGVDIHWNGDLLHHGYDDRKSDEKNYDVWQKLFTPDGASHYLGNLTNTISGPMEAIDGSSFLMPNGNFVYTDGAATTRQLISNTMFEDRNGNQIVTPTLSATQLSDALGRTLPNPASLTATTSDTVGCPAGANASRVDTVPIPGGQNGTIKYCYQNFTLSNTMDPTQYHTGTASATFLTRIILPNQTHWTFTYDPNLGNLLSVTLPAGSTITYTWSTGGPFCPSGRTYGPSIVVTSRTVNANDGSPLRKWQYTYDSGQTIVTDPLGNDTVHTPDYCGGVDTRVQYYQGSYSSGTLLKTIDTEYQTQPNPYASDAGDHSKIEFPTRITTIWPNGQVSRIVKVYDTALTFYDDTYHGKGKAYTSTYGKVVEEDDYDYAQNTPGVVDPTQVQPGPLLRKTITNYFAFSNPTYLSNHLIDLVSSIQVQDLNGNQKSLTMYNYDEFALASSGIGASEQHDASPPTGTARGNGTSVLRWLNTGTMTCPSGQLAGSGANVTSKTIYYDTGVPQSATDPCGNATSYVYSSSYWGALPTAVTNALNQSTNRTFDLNSGLVSSVTDPNSLTTSYSYDNMARLHQVTHPDGGLETISYQESSFPFTATLSTQINTAETKSETNVFDGLGRVTQHQLTSDAQGTDYIDTTYDGLGHIATVSNPHRACGSDITSSCGTTTYAYDGLDRKVSETDPDNSVLKTVYCGPWTLVIDPTTRWRRSRVDGLGRLIEVDEPNAPMPPINPTTGCPGTNDPVWATTYTLDPLGNLTNVLQNGSHARTFTYDSLSRLLTSANPEVGTITYAYNPDGPILTKTDARAIVTCYGTWNGSSCNASSGYDALHRELTRTFSDSTPSVTTAYDQSACLNLSSCQNLGHRTSVTDGGGSEHWAFQVDATNRRSAHAEQRTTISSPNNITKTTNYLLDFLGNVYQVTYPTNRVVNYTFDTANRPSTAMDSANGITYATGLQTSPGGSCIAKVTCYTPQGTPYAVSLGQTSSFTGLNITNSYNGRLQPNEFKALSPGGSAIDISYNYIDPVIGGNAGHVFSVANNLNSSRSQSFTYDQVSRILSAGTTATTGQYCWGYQFIYDGANNTSAAYGNLTSQPGWSPTYNACTQPTMPVSISDGNNHLSSLAYDASGNTTSDGAFAYTWNAESEVKTAAGVTYNYDADGSRVAKVGSKLYWYGSGSEILAETDAYGNTTNEYVFFGGKRVALLPNGSTAQYYVEDALGSSRVITTNTGVVCYDADFYPYGGERTPYTDTCTQNNYKFEGKERDPETSTLPGNANGNDDFGARYYSNRYGRWLSADWSATPVAVPYANLTNPQTLNLYSMVADDPESFDDLDGHWTAPYEWANWADSKINSAVNYVQMKAIASGSPTLAAATTFATGATGDVAKGFTNLLRTGESVGSLPSGASGGQIATAAAEEGGRVGGTILAVVAVAGPKAPATAEQGISVANEIGRNRVTMDNGSVVDVAGKTHREKSTGENVPTPHVKDPVYNTNPNTGVTYQNGYGPTRQATVGDINAAASQAGARPPAPIPPPVPVPKKENQ